MSSRRCKHIEAILDSTSYQVSHILVLTFGLSSFPQTRPAKTVGYDTLYDFAVRFVQMQADQISRSFPVLPSYRESHERMLHVHRLPIEQTLSACISTRVSWAMRERSLLLARLPRQYSIRHTYHISRDLIVWSIHICSCERLAFTLHVCLTRGDLRAHQAFGLDGNTRVVIYTYVVDRPYPDYLTVERRTPNHAQAPQLPSQDVKSRKLAPVKILFY